MVEIDSDAVTGGDGDNGGGSGGSGGGGSSTERTNVHMKGEYGTETFSPNTRCEFCGQIAEGVMAVRDGMLRFVPVCSDKRREIEEKWNNSARDDKSFDDVPYETFEED